MLAGKNVTIEGVGSFVSAKKVFDSVGGNFTEKRRGVFERNRRGRWLFRLGKKNVRHSAGGNFAGKRRGVFERNRRGRWITVLYRMLFRFFLTKTAKNKQKLPQRIGYP